MTTPKFLDRARQWLSNQNTAQQSSSNDINWMLKSGQYQIQMINNGQEARNFQYRLERLEKAIKLAGCEAEVTDALAVIDTLED